MRIRISLTTALLILGLGGQAAGAASTRASTSATAADASFLSHYALGSGRIDRIDQGGDTVSAGQAYGMLMTVALGDRRRFAVIWRWTRTHLMRRDGLLASRWGGGHVIDHKSASDADLDAARALVLAGRRFRARVYLREGSAMARAILAHETEQLGRSLVLLAGSWARRSAIVDPGYWAPRTFGPITHFR